MRQGRDRQWVFLLILLLSGGFIIGRHVWMIERPTVEMAGGFLGELHGRLAIFAADGQLNELTDIPLESIRLSERANLREGILFVDEDDRQQLIDGLVGD